MKKKLWYLSKLAFLFLLFASQTFSQNITNTLGNGGVFSIKDTSTNFLTLNQSNGQVKISKTLRLESTTGSDAGVIYKGSDRFLHTFGLNNTFMGNYSGNFTLGGDGNTGIGYATLSNLTSGSMNTAVGGLVLTHNTTGIGNTGLGLQALYYNTTGTHNTALGILSLNTNTTGDYNTGVGNRSLVNNTTGDYNTAVGNSSMYSNMDGNQNTAIGYGTLHSNHSGNHNTALGLNALNSNTSGNENTAIGFSTGSSIINGNNLTLIGNNAEPSTANAINQITLGNNQITSLRCNVQTITSLSDARDKKNVKDLSLGLDFLMKLKPRAFHWDKREWYENNVSDGSKISESPTAGFIAQELDEVQTKENAEWLNLVLKDNPEKIEASYGNLLPVMVKAIQELKVENIVLKNKLEQVLNELTAVKHASLK